MGKVIYYVASSLDGFIATEDHNLDWLTKFGFEPYRAHFDRFMAGVGSLVMGSATYDWVRADQPDSWDFGTKPCFVATTRSLTAPPESDVRFVSGDIRAISPAAVTAAGSGNVWVVGGGVLAAQFVDAGLLDEIWVTYMPVALGRGRPLLPVAEVSPRMHLVGTTAFNGGAAELRFALA